MKPRGMKLESEPLADAARSFDGHSHPNSQFAHPLQVGSVHLATNLLLAPIAGYCDLAFRLVARSCGGLGMACTDLLCPEGVLRENRKSMELAQTCPEDSPLAMQLYGGDGEKLWGGARWAEDRGAHVMYIDMGCPGGEVIKRCGGR